MAANLKGSDSDKLHELCNKTYKDQAVWFLNAFWHDFAQKEAENVWKWVELCVDLDDQKKAGTALDELKAHRFLEKIGDTHTVLQLRSQLRKASAIGESERPKTVPISHYFLFRFECDWHRLVNASQGDNAESLAEAQKAVDEAVRTAKACQEAERELQAALADVKKQEEERDQKTKELTAQSESGGVVARNKAKALLSQHLAEDPLPLRKAKITLEAAVKKAEKATAAAVKAQADAEERLRILSATAGSAQGAIWWMERELTEAKRFMPISKGGIR
jgi:hypothetical protein